MYNNKKPYFHPIPFNPTVHIILAINIWISQMWANCESQPNRYVDVYRNSRLTGPYSGFKYELSPQERISIKWHNDWLQICTWRELNHPRWWGIRINMVRISQGSRSHWATSWLFNYPSWSSSASLAIYWFVDYAAEVAVACRKSIEIGKSLRLPHGNIVVWEQKPVAGARKLSSREYFLPLRLSTG